MAHPRRHLACLALVLSPLSPGAHRITQDAHVHNGNLSTVVGDERQALVHNTCKGVGQVECTQKKEMCVWDGDRPAAMRCQPKTCTDLYGSDCRELPSQCLWDWDTEKGTGKCLNKAILRDNPCRGLGTVDCTSKDCQFGFAGLGAVRTCRPRSCAGIRGSHCRELTHQCSWKWDPESKIGECLEQPEATTTTSTKAGVKVKSRDDPCKNLPGNYCRQKVDDCNYEFNVQTLKGICRPKSCTGIRAGDCMDLAGKCLYNTSDHRCLEIPKGLQGMRNLCKDFTDAECQENADMCEWAPRSCKPRVCQGLWFIDCLALLHRCTWESGISHEVGTCVDYIPTTTATTTSAGSRAARLVSLLLVNLLAVTRLSV